MSEEQIDTLKQAIKAWGEKAQCDMLIEECAELIQALSKYHRAKPNDLQKRYDNLSEEIADVEILLFQIKLIFNNEIVVNNWKHQKLIRLKERLKISTKTP